jgi:hypothetical protein
MKKPKINVVFENTIETEKPTREYFLSSHSTNFIKEFAKNTSSPISDCDLIKYSTYEIFEESIILPNTVRTQLKSCKPTFEASKFQNMKMHAKKYY